MQRAHARGGRARDEDGGPCVLLCAHLDTVPHDGVVEPVCEDGGWVSAGDTILGADNKAAVAVLLAVARRVAAESAPVGVELLFTTGEETALRGAKAFDVSRLRVPVRLRPRPRLADRRDRRRLADLLPPEASLRGQAAHAGIAPESGRSAIAAAARGDRRDAPRALDEETTANVGAIEGGHAGATNVVPEHATFLAEARSLDPVKAEAVVAEMVDHVHDAANTPACACDADVVVEKLFDGYRHRPNAPAVLAAEAALRACGYTPSRIETGGGSDANAFEAQGFPCTNLANGTERNHRSDERVSTAALEGMLDVVLALLDEVAALPAA